MGRALRRVTRGVRDVIDVATGGLTNTGKSPEERMLEEQRKAQEQALKQQEEARRREELRKKEEAEYNKKVESQKQETTNTVDGTLDQSNVGLGDVKVDFGKLLTSEDEDKDSLKKALKG